MRNPEKREKILKIATDLSLTFGYTNLKLCQVAAKANIAESLVRYYFTSFLVLKKEVMEKAIREKLYPIILEGIFTHNIQALQLPPKIIVAALKSCSIPHINKK